MEIVHACLVPLKCHRRGKSVHNIIIFDWERRIDIRSRLAGWLQSLCIFTEGRHLITTPPPLLSPQWSWRIWHWCDCGGRGISKGNDSMSAWFSLLHSLSMPGWGDEFSTLECFCCNYFPSWTGIFILSEQYKDLFSLSSIKITCRCFSQNPM